MISCRSALRLFVCERVRLTATDGEPDADYANHLVVLSHILGGNRFGGVRERIQKAIEVEVLGAGGRAEVEAERVVEAVEEGGRCEKQLAEGAEAELHGGGHFVGGSGRHRMSGVAVYRGEGGTFVEKVKG